MNQLRTFFENNKSNVINKWNHYFDIYEHHFRKYKESGERICLLEIGVFQGGSINMWKDYFGDNVDIFAIDINPLCKGFERDGVRIFIGSQEDERFVEEVRQEIPQPHIIIDDGGHSMNQLITSFKILFPHLKEGGTYLMEDLHTCYMYNYGGGLKRTTSLIEYSKDLIDQIHAWYSESDRLKPNYFTKNIYSLHYYDSILVIDKKSIAPPKSLMSGEYVYKPEVFDEVLPFETPSSFVQRFLRRIRYRLYKLRYG